jgi:hypothetical protein
VAKAGSFQLAVASRVDFLLPPDRQILDVM